MLVNMSYTLSMENEIKRLIELCGCDVKLDSRDHRLSEPGLDGCVGFYWPSSKLWLSNIELGPAMSEAAKIACLAHEVGHALCGTNKCICEKEVWAVNGSAVLSEYHAMKFASKWLLDNRCLEAMRHHITLIESQSKDCPSPHNNAARRLTKLKLWEKCKNYANESD